MNPRLFHYSAIIVICLFGLLASLPTHPNFGFLGADQEVFKYFGMLIHQGGMPYRDAFDNKPPLIFLFHASTHGWYPVGAWVLELLVTLVAALALFTLAKQKRWPIPVLYPVYYIVLLRFPDFFCGGGLTRSIDANFICLFLVLCYLETSLYLFLMGALAMVVFLFQQNDAPALLVPFFLFYATRFRWRSQLMAVFGACSIALPILYWLYSGASLRQFLTDSFLFNLNVYAFKPSFLTILSLAKETFASHFLKLWMVAILGLMLCLFHKGRFGELKQRYFVLALGMFVQAYMMNITGVRFPHYFLSLVPWLIFVSGEVFLRCREKLFIHKNEPLLYLITLGVLSFLPSLSLGRVVDQGIKAYKALPASYQSSLPLALRETLKGVAGKRGAFYVYGNMTLLAANTEYNIIAPTRWDHILFWQVSPTEQWDPDHSKFQEILSDLDKSKTQYILDCSSSHHLDSPELEQTWQQYLKANYSLLKKMDEGSLYIRNSSAVIKNTQALDPSV